MGREKVALQLIGCLLFLSLGAAAQVRSLSDAEIKAYLPNLIEPGQREANIVLADGQYLHDLVVRTQAKRVLEIGTANGYSAIWMAMGLRKTAGHLVTLEIHEAHHAAAAGTSGGDRAWRHWSTRV